MSMDFFKIKSMCNSYFLCCDYKGRYNEITEFPLYLTILNFLLKWHGEFTVVKEENADFQHFFFLFPLHFLPFQIHIASSVTYLICRQFSAEKKKKHKKVLDSTEVFMNYFWTNFCPDLFEELKDKCLPFPKRRILKSSKLKEVADDKFKFDKNYRKFSKSVENEQFLLFPLCFQETCTADT